MIRAIFLSPLFSIAEYWARYWGFAPHEWKLLIDFPDIDGIDFSEVEIYVAGSSETIRYSTKQVVDYLQRHTEARFVNAQADTFENRESWFDMLSLGG